MVSKYSNEEVLDITKSFAELSSGIQGQWDFLYSEIHKTDVTQCDILHEIENSDKLGAVEGYKLYKKLRDLRKHRRELKNQQQLIEPLYKWCQGNKTIGINLFKVKSSMDNVKGIQDNWIYHKRTEGEII